MRLLITTFLVASFLYAQNDPKTAKKTPRDENDEHWHQTVQDIRLAYRAWGRVDDEARWAPWLCRAPNPGYAHFSKAKKGTPHSEKLYTLFAKDAAAYGAPKSASESFVMFHAKDEHKAAIARIAKLEQVLVKESWIPEKMTEKPSGHRFSKDCNWGKAGVRPAKKGEHWYRGNQPGPLFMMFKPGKTDKPTDAGWIYATIGTDGKVSGAGRMQSCISCHQSKPSRLFGLKKPPVLDGKKE